MVSPSVTGPRDRYHSLSVFFSLPGWGTTEPEGRSKLAAAAGGFGLGWAGLCLTVLPVGSLVGFRNGVSVVGMDDGTRLYWLPSGSPSKLFSSLIWPGPVRSVSRLARSAASLDLSPAARDE